MPSPVALVGLGLLVEPPGAHDYTDTGQNLILRVVNDSMTISEHVDERVDESLPASSSLARIRFRSLSASLFRTPSKPSSCLQQSVRHFNSAKENEASLGTAIHTKSTSVGRQGRCTILGSSLTASDVRLNSPCFSIPSCKRLDDEWT